jgi:hypothetical protein
MAQLVALNYRVANLKYEHMKNLLKSIALVAALATPTLAAPTLAAADADPLTGAWNVKGSVEGFPVRIHCEFERRGDQLAGLCRDGGADGTAHGLSMGTIQGDHVTWAYHRRVFAHNFEPQYSGVVDGLTMKGTISVAGHSGDFTAQRED